MSVKVLTVLLLLCWLGYNLQAQIKPTVSYQDGFGNEVTQIEDAERFVLFERRGKKKKSLSGIESTYLKDSTLIQYRELVKGNANGHFYAYDPETGVSYRGKMLGVVKVGNWYYTDSLSNIIKVEVYDRSGNNIVTTDLAANDNTIYRSPDLPAQYPGGNAGWSNHLKKTLRYPLEAMKKGITGTVVVEFYTAKDGSIMDIFVLSSPDKLLSDEAERVVRAGGKWDPAIKDNAYVNGIHELKIRFNVRGNGLNSVFPKIPRTPYPKLRGS